MSEAVARYFDLACSVVVMDVSYDGPAIDGGNGHQTCGTVTRVWKGSTLVGDQLCVVPGAIQPIIDGPLGDVRATQTWFVTCGERPIGWAYYDQVPRGLDDTLAALVAQQALPQARWLRAVAGAPPCDPVDMPTSANLPAAVWTNEGCLCDVHRPTPVVAAELSELVVDARIRRAPFWFGRGAYRAHVVQELKGLGRRSYPLRDPQHGTACAFPEAARGRALLFTSELRSGPRFGVSACTFTLSLAEKWCLDQTLYPGEPCRSYHDVVAEIEQQRWRPDCQRASGILATPDLYDPVGGAWR